MGEETEFEGAKLALFVGSRLAVILRDDRPGLPWAGFLDLPGGAREGTETPERCVLRETHEELGLIVPQDALVWKRRFQGERGRPVWFFAAHVSAACESLIRLGDEGQSWQLIGVGEYLSHPRAIPHFASRVGAYLSRSDDKT